MGTSRILMLMAIGGGLLTASYATAGRILYYDSEAVASDLTRMGSETDAAFVTSSDATTALGTSSSFHSAQASQAHTVTLGGGTDKQYNFGTGVVNGTAEQSLANGIWLGTSFEADQDLTLDEISFKLFNNSNNGSSYSARDVAAFVRIGSSGAFTQFGALFNSATGNGNQGTVLFTSAFGILAGETVEIRLAFTDRTRSNQDGQGATRVGSIDISAVAGIVPGSRVTLKYGSPFQDGMVLQRGKPLKVWGTADPTNLVTVSINGTNSATISDLEGNWTTILPALMAGGPYELMAVSGTQTNTLTDVLVGDVWITFGQSNMVRPLSEMINKTPYINEITTNTMIRCLKISQAAATSPQDSGAMTWLDNSNPGSWTSVGAVFAHDMHQASGVPTAIIWAAWGSSSIEGWMPIQMTDDFPHFDAIMQDYYANDEATVEGMLDGSITYNDVYIRTRPNIIYNQMIHPLLNVGISGFVWYQGEANASEADDTAQYGFTLPAFAKEYRKLFDQGDLPYLGVQLPSHNRTYWPWFRESQNQLTTLSNAYVAVTIDTGLVNNIHPYDKEPIGQRLALLGRNYALGEMIEAHGPTFESMSISGNVATISFSHAAGLTTNDTSSPAEFELAGSDEVWHAATSSSISGTNVIISSSSEPSPVAVRYAWSPAPVNEVNLVNSIGLPAAPFRTDSWAMPGLGAQTPMAVKDSYSVFTNDTLLVSASGVLENDMDLNRDALSASLVTDVSYGTLSLASDGSFSYIADADFSGFDSFMYAASDGSLFGTATVTIAVQLATLADGYSDTFDNDGLALNLGTGGGLINKTWFGSAWVDDGNLTGPVSATRWFRSLAYTALSYPVSNGFSLDVSYSITNIVVGVERSTATFGLVADDATEADMDILFSREMPIYGIGMSLTDCTAEDGVQGLHTDTETLTLLSNAQPVTAGTNRTFNLTMKPDGSWSYSIDGATATTGTNLVFDLSKNYRFAAFVRQDPGFTIQSVSLVPFAEVTEIGDVDFEIQPGGTELGFSWYGEAGATYGLEMTENIVTGIWETVTNIMGANAVIALSDEIDKTNAFYRVYLAE